MTNLEHALEVFRTRVASHDSCGNWQAEIAVLIAAGKALTCKACGGDGYEDFSYDDTKCRECKEWRELCCKEHET